MQKCELCGAIARAYCESDQARLCWVCDSRVHSANFLVARHSRTLLCRACQSTTPWQASGPKLSPTLSLCHRCCSSSSSSSSSSNNISNNKVTRNLSSFGQQQQQQQHQQIEEEEFVEVGELSDRTYDGDEEEEEEQEEEEEEEVEEDGDNQVVPWSTEEITPPPPPVSSSSSESCGRAVSSGLFSSRWGSPQDDLRCSSSQPCFPASHSTTNEEETSSLYGHSSYGDNRRKGVHPSLGAAQGITNGSAKKPYLCHRWRNLG